MKLKNYRLHKNKLPKKTSKYLVWSLGLIGITSAINVHAAECTTAGAESRLFQGFPLTACWCGPDNPNRNNLISGVAHIEGSGAPVQVVNTQSIQLGFTTQTVVYVNTSSNQIPKQKYSCVWNGAKFISGGLVTDPTDPTGPDQLANLVHGAIIQEPVNMPTSSNSLEKAIDLFDFKIDDTESQDGLPIKITDIRLKTSGTGDFNKITWLLSGPDIENAIGSYSSIANTVTFSGLNLSIASQTDETYVVAGYFNSLSNITANSIFLLSINGNTSLTITEDSSGFTNTTSINNGSGTKVIVMKIDPLLELWPQIVNSVLKK